MLRTRVGYCGGSKPSPTYHDLGDHTETIEIDFDPSVTSYDKLLRVFLSAHDCFAKPYSRQYRSVVFAHDERQADAAARALAARGEGKTRAPATAIERDFVFWLAEDYHQKYRLRSRRALDTELQKVYPDLRDYVDSTVVTRLNAWVAGQGTPAELGVRVGDLGLSEEASKQLAERLVFKED